MEDLIAERIRRLHGDFLDPNGEYDLVSSLSKRANPASAAADEWEDNELGYLPYHGEKTGSNQLLLFYTQIIGTMLLVAAVVGYFYQYQWISSTSNRNKCVDDDNDKSPTRDNRLSQKNADGDRMAESATTTSAVIQITKSETTTTTKTTTTSLESFTKTNRVLDDEKIVSESTSSPHKRQRTIPNDATSDGTPEHIIDSNQQPASPSLRRRKTRQLPSAESPSKSEPPELMDELQFQPSFQQNTSKRIFSRSCTTTPIQSSRHDKVAERTRSSISLPNTPIPPPSPTTLFPKSNTSNGVDESFYSSCSDELEAAQQLAQTFCHKVQVIEQVFAQSGTAVDVSRAVELAMMQQQHAHEQSMREQQQNQNELSSTSEGYLQARVPLQKGRDDCIQATWGAVYHSFWVVVLLEGGRQAMDVLSALEYFSIHDLGWTVLQSTCGCYEPTTATYSANPEMDTQLGITGGQHGSLFLYSFSLVSNVMSMATSAAATTRYSLETLIMVADYVTCFLSYALILTGVILLHTLMQHLRCPACLHQLVNAGMVLLWVARNPATWLMVMENVDAYSKLAVVQVVLTFGSMVWVETLYRRARGQILKLERDQHAQKDASVSSTIRNRDATRTGINHVVVQGVAHLENVRSVVGLAPPLLLGSLVFLSYWSAQSQSR